MFQITKVERYSEITVNITGALVGDASQTLRCMVGETLRNGAHRKTTLWCDVRLLTDVDEKGEIVLLWLAYIGCKFIVGLSPCFAQQLCEKMKLPAVLEVMNWHH